MTIRSALAALLLTAATLPAMAQEATAPAPAPAATPAPAPAPEATAEAPAQPAATADTVVATVNGKPITLGHMVVVAQGLPAQYQQLPDDVLFRGILDQLVQQSLLEQSAEGTLTLRDRLAMENDRRGYVASTALRKVVAGAVTDEALKAAYDAQVAGAETKAEYNADHILVESEEKAKELKAQLDGGADFAELARANSTDPGSGPNGGSLGWFGLGQMVKPFEDAVVALTPGEISAPVQSQFGWHLVRLNETRDAAVPTLDEIRDELAAQIERQAVEAHLAELTAKADVARPGEGIDPGALRTLSLDGM